MLVVTVEMWPGGDSSRARVLERGIIFNDGSGSPDVGNYVVELKKSTRFGGDAEATVGCRPRRKVWKSGAVRGFPRRSARLGVWDLLRSALNSALEGRATTWGVKTPAHE